MVINGGITPGDEKKKFFLTLNIAIHEKLEALERVIDVPVEGVENPASTLRTKVDKLIQAYLKTEQTTDDYNTLLSEASSFISDFQKNVTIKPNYLRDAADSLFAIFIAIVGFFGKKMVFQAYDERITTGLKDILKQFPRLEDAGMEKNPPGMIQSAGDFEQAMKSLSLEDRVILFEAKKDDLPGMIQSAKDFEIAFEHLSPEQALTICNALRDNPPTEYNLEDAIKQLPPEQKKVITQEDLASAQETTAAYKEKVFTLKDDVRKNSDAHSSGGRPTSST